MRLLMAAAFSLVAAVNAVTFASAVPNANDIIEALQNAPVYVADGTEGTNPDTAGVLLEQLRDNDQVVLVMLPEDPSLTPETLNALTEKISDGLNDERIIGITVGDQFDATASILPSGTADELMKRADTVSTNAVETLITFARNVHDWQRLNPDLVAPPADPADAGAWMVWLIGGGVVVIISTVIAVVMINRRRIRSTVHYTAPSGLNDYVTRLMRLRENLDAQDTRMRHAIEMVCKHTEAYFKRFTAEKRVPLTVKAFERHLDRAEQVITEYTYASKNPDYVDDSKLVIDDGVQSMEALADIILDSIKRGNNKQLMDYKVITTVLKADGQRDTRSRSNDN